MDKVIEVIPWQTFFRVVNDTRITLQIVPDQTVQTTRAIESILNTFHSMHEGFMDRIWNEGFSVVYKSQDFASYRMVFEYGKITFYIVVPSEYKKAVVHSLNNVWPRCAITEVEQDLSKLSPANTLCAYVELRDHFFKSTLVDRTRVDPLPSLMASSRNVIEDDLAVLDIAFIPLGKRWQGRVREAREKFRRGIEPRKLPNSLLDIIFMLGDFLVDVVMEKALGFIDIAFGHDLEKQELQRSTRDLTPASNQKSEYPGFDTIIRVASYSKSRPRAELTLNAIGTAFKDLSSDNELEIRKVANNKKFIDQLVNNKPPLLRINGNIMSVPEGSQILQLPQIGLQEEYPEIESISIRETEADKALLDPTGLFLGEVTFKKQTSKIYFPIKDKDELCLPHVVIGGMGQGKTKGFLANWMVESYFKGFGSLAIDAAKKEIGDQIQALVDIGLIPKEDFVRIDLGKMTMSMDWCEALYHEQGKSRLASTVIDFFDIQTDTTGQTGRFLRACIMAMKTGKLSEIIQIFEDEARIEEAIKDLPAGSLARQTMEQYKKASGMRKQYTSPIYNRLDMILGDEHLASCVDSDRTLDMVKVMSTKKIIVIDLADYDLVPLQQDVLINILMSKIDLAVRLRAKVFGPKAEHPFFVLMDEPAKYLRSAKIWESACVQYRKWGVGQVWSFHYWEQIPAGLQKAIRNALPHYHLYPSSKLTWKSIEDEIKPFELEHALKVKRWHAINIIRTGGENVTPVIVKMADPPADRFHK